MNSCIYMSTTSVRKIWGIFIVEAILLSRNIQLVIVVKFCTSTWHLFILNRRDFVAAMTTMTTAGLIISFDSQNKQNKQKKQKTTKISNEKSARNKTIIKYTIKVSSRTSAIEKTSQYRITNYSTTRRKDIVLLKCHQCRKGPTTPILFYKVCHSSCRHLCICIIFRINDIFIGYVSIPLVFGNAATKKLECLSCEFQPMSIVDLENTIHLHTILLYVDQADLFAFNLRFATASIVHKATGLSLPYRQCLWNKHKFFLDDLST